MATTSSCLDVIRHPDSAVIDVWSAQPDFTQAEYLPLEEVCEVVNQYELQLETITSGGIAQAKRTLARLREMRNSRHRHKLPPELLILIFTDVCRISGPGGSLDLMAITHVCRAWRATALGVHELWSSIVVTSLSRDGIYSFVERAGDHALLDLRWELGSRTLGGLQFLSKFRRRLRSVVVTADNLEGIANAMDELAWEHYPCLESLCLLGPNTERVRYERLVSKTFLMPPAPSLRSLQLRPMIFSWDSGVYQQLTFLDIDTTHSTALTLEHFLTILRRCPELMEMRLRVEGDLAVLHVPPEDGSWAVTLPRLTELEMHGLFSGTALSLLSHLTLPAFARYNVNLYLTHTLPPPTFVVIFPLNHPVISAPKSLKLEAVDGLHMHVTLYPSYAPGPPVELTLTLTTYYGSNVMIPFIPVGVLESESLVDLTAVGSPASPTHFLNWDAVFRRSAYLRVLRFVQPHPGDIARVLAALVFRLPCPALERLELVELSFTPFLEEAVLKVVRERFQKGVALRALEVRDAIGASVGFAQRLRDLSRYFVPAS